VRAKTPARCLAGSRWVSAELLEQEPHIAVAMLPVPAGRLTEVVSA